MKARTSPLGHLTDLWFQFFILWMYLLPDLPRVLNMPLQIYLPRGMEGRLTCPVEANPPVTLTVWTLNERQIDVAHNKRLKVTKDGTLIFKNILTTDEGRYTCTPYSPLGAGRSSSVVQVYVKGKNTTHYLIHYSHLTRAP